jgi:arginine decarboxylase
MNALEILSLVSDLNLRDSDLRAQTPYLDALFMRSATAAPYSLPMHRGTAVTDPKSCAELFSAKVTRLDRAATGDLYDARKALNAKLSAIYGGMTQSITLGGSAANRMAIRTLLAVSNTQSTQEVLINRNAHISVVDALTSVPLAEPRFTKLRFSRYGAVLPPGAKDIAAMLTGRTAVVVVTYPTPVGLCTDLNRIRACIDEHNLHSATKISTKLHVDQAYGAHFPFAPGVLPQSALHAGADSFATSLQKQLRTFTQSAAFGVKVSDSDSHLLALARRIARADGTTSPLSIILACIDAATGSSNNEAYLKMLVRDVNALRKNLSDIPGVHLLEEDLFEELFECKDRYQVSIDPCKLTFRIEGMRGPALLTALRLHQAETLISDGDYASMHFSKPLLEEEHSRIVLAVKNAAQSVRSATTAPIPMFPNAPCARTPHDVLYKSRTEEIPYAQALGRICGEAITPVPPGIPLVIEGQYITDEVMTAIRYWQAQKVHISGIDENHRITVIADSEPYTHAFE